MEFFLEDSFERGEQLRATQGRWTVGVIETRVFWPSKAQAVRYGAREFLLLPAFRPNGSDIDQAPAVALRTDNIGISAEQARLEIMQFASVIAWQRAAKLEIAAWTGGNLPRSMGFVRNRSVASHFDPEDLPSPKSSAAQTALAFFREGLSLDNPFYSFLSFYKAFTIAISEGRARSGWIESHRQQLKDSASARATEIEAAGGNLGDYLYKQGRHAIAHADHEPFVNPDNSADHYRMYRDAPIMQALARMAIEESLGVKTPETIYREHLYELDGFRQLIPPAARAALKEDEGLLLDVHIQWPQALAILAVREGERYALPDMHLHEVVWIGSKALLRFVSHSLPIAIRVWLDFPEERLMFEPLLDLSYDPRRLTRAHLEGELAIERFQYSLFCNSHIEIWDANNRRRLGRGQPYFLVNAMIAPDRYKARVEELEQLIKGYDDQRT